MVSVHVCNCLVERRQWVLDDLLPPLSFSTILGARLQQTVQEMASRCTAKRGCHRPTIFASPLRWGSMQGRAPSPGRRLLS